MKKIGIVLLVGIVLLTGCGKTIDEKNEGKNEEIINNDGSYFLNIKL